MGGRSEPPSASLPLLRGSWRGRSLCFLLSKGETTTHPSDSLRRLNLIYCVHSTSCTASVQQMLTPSFFFLFKKLSRSSPRVVLSTGEISNHSLKFFPLLWSGSFLMTLGTEYETFLQSSNTYFINECIFQLLLCVTETG